MPRNRRPRRTSLPTRTESTLMALLGVFTATVAIMAALDGGPGPRNVTGVQLALALLLVLIPWMVSFRSRLRRAERPRRAPTSKRAA